MGYGETHAFALLKTEPARMIDFGLERNHIDALTNLPELVAAELNQSY